MNMLTIPTIPPPVRIPSTTPAARYVPVTVPPLPPTAPTKPFPFVPSEIWDAAPGQTRVAVWQVENSKCAFWRGAVALGLRRQERGEVMYVKTSCEELAMLIVWSWEHK